MAIQYFHDLCPMFDQFYQQSSDRLKLAFLEKALRKHPHLKEDFLAFYLTPQETPLEMTVSDPDDFILASVDLIREDLESIDMEEPDRERYAPRRGGYIHEHEAREQLIEDQLFGIIAFHVGLVERYCAEKHFDLAFLYMISLYKACLEVELEDEYDALHNVNHILHNGLEDQLQACMSLFKAIQLSENQLFTIATVVSDQFHNYHQHDPGFLPFIEPYLFAVIHSGAEAAILLDLLREKKVGDHVPWLYTELVRKTSGTAVWEKSALQFYKKDKSVANALLEFYRTGHKSEFARIARDLWDEGLYRLEFADLYFETLQVADQPEFYKEITIHLNNQNFSPSYYGVLRELMEKEERLNYLETFKRNKPAYVGALCMEEMFADALQFADQHIDRWNMVEIMAPCLLAQPKAALQLLERKIEELLVDERGRNFYERIASVLEMAADIPAIREDVKKLVIRIYSFYSRLSALRGELRKAGLIKL